MGELISLSERRTRLRRGIGLPAQIERDGQASLRCQLIDISRHGACVSAPDIALPTVFVLKVPDASRHTCEVLWRNDRMASGSPISTGFLRGPRRRPPS